MGALLTVNKTFPFEKELSTEFFSDLLSIVKDTVKDIRDNNPELANYKLYDIGFKPNGTKIDIRFYFLRNDLH